METLPEQLNVTLTVLTVSPSTLRYTWGINGLVLWIEDLSADNSLMQHYSYRLLLRDTNYRWHAVRVNETGQFVGTVPLEELDYEVAYEKVMWVDE